jgi:hypothetical protein
LLGARGLLRHANKTERDGHNGHAKKRTQRWVTREDLAESHSELDAPNARESRLAIATQQV